MDRVTSRLRCEDLPGSESIALDRLRWLTMPKSIAERSMDTRMALRILTSTNSGAVPR